MFLGAFFLREREKSLCRGVFFPIKLYKKLTDFSVSETLFVIS